MNFAVNRQVRIAEESNPSYRKVPVTASYKMTVTDTVLKVDSSSGALTITLPPVSEVGELDYLIKMVGVTPAVVTIVDKGDSVAWSNRTLTTTTAAMIFASDGEQWYLMLSVA